MPPPPAFSRSSVLQGVFLKPFGQRAVQPSVATRVPGQIQRRPGMEAFQVSLIPKSGGWPLPPVVQSRMETALGANFSDVRIHVGSEASAIGAVAFTWGSDIYFAPGRYNPHTQDGQCLLGHELVHVVQQRAGRVANPFGSGLTVVQDLALEVEADRMGRMAAMHQQRDAAPVKATPHPPAFGTITRKMISPGGGSFRAPVPGTVTPRPHAAALQRARAIQPSGALYRTPVKAAVPRPQSAGLPRRPMVAGGFGAVQRFRTPQVSQGAAFRSTVLQAFIPVHFQEWSKAHTGGLAGLNTYVELVRNELAAAAGFDETDALERTKQAFMLRLGYARQFPNKTTFKSAVRSLDDLVDQINRVLVHSHDQGWHNDFNKEASKKPPTEGGGVYPVTDWQKGIHKPLIETFTKLIGRSVRHLTPSGNGNPAVPVVAYSVAKRYLPWSLCFLIDRIHAGWESGTPLDTRTDEERGDRNAGQNPSIGVGRAGAMRSWHLDAHGLLPANNAEGLQGNPQAVHQYAARFSGTMNIMGNHASPEGYIEYTGTGHENDYDKIRVLLDYKNGRIFLTSHYQLWTPDGEVHGQTPDNRMDWKNPWINLDMAT